MELASNEDEMPQESCRRNEVKKGADDCDRSRLVRARPDRGIGKKCHVDKAADAAQASDEGNRKRRKAHPPTPRTARMECDGT